jgi:hypothetical protein
MATLAQVGTRDQSFWQKMTIGIALFIVFGFAQFGARGMVDYRGAPVYLHLHAVVMIAWLALTVVQATLVARDNLALHRRLGWIGAGLVTVVIVMGGVVSFRALQTHHFPPFFTTPFFFALTVVELLAFTGMMVAAIRRRRETEWHRRLMIGALVLLMEPALGRVLPMPLLMPWGEWATLAVQLGVLVLVARHDRKTLGAIHPATTVSMLVVALTHGLFELLAVSPFWQGA